MTLSEARYVMQHHEMYDDFTLRYAMDILKRAGELG